MRPGGVRNLLIELARSEFVRPIHHRRNKYLIFHQAMNKTYFQLSENQMAQLYVDVALRFSLDRRKTLHQSGNGTFCVDLGMSTIDVHTWNRMLALMAAIRLASSPRRAAEPCRLVDS